MQSSSRLDGDGQPPVNAAGKMKVEDRIPLVVAYATEHQPEFTRTELAEALGCSQAVVAYTTNDKRLARQLKTQGLKMTYAGGKYTVSHVRARASAG